MPRKKKQKISVNDSTSLEGLLQEIYNDACGLIKDAQKTINQLDAATNPEDVDDYTKIAKEKSNAMKIKESGVKAKLEVSKLLGDIIKHNGNVEEGIHSASGGQASADDMKSIRDLIKGKSDGEN